jgi:DNA-binding NtrC family response regulator
MQIETEMEAETAVQHSAAHVEHRAKSTTKRILVVDDDASVREMLTRVLRGEHYLASAVSGGEEALKAIAKTRLDLVLLDLSMPLRDGWETLEQLSAKDPLLPVIIITAQPNQFFKALAAGVGALLEKPLDFHRLIETIDELLREPMERRLARMAGELATFRHSPAIGFQTGN